jgi:hypothetical protein
MLAAPRTAASEMVPPSVFAREHSMNPATVRKLCKEAESRRRRSDRVIATATELGTPVRGEPDRSSYGPSNGCGRADLVTSTYGIRDPVIYVP